MARTKTFKSGNSQAVRLPADIAFSEMGLSLEVSRHGDVVLLYPAPRRLAEGVAELRKLPKPPYAEFRDAIEVPERKRD